MRRFLIAIGILAGLTAAGWYAYQQVWLPRQETATAPDYEIAAVGRGTIESTVSATGSIEPAAQLDLTFRTPGYVQTLLVVEGQPVEAGQLLAELDTTDLTLALAQAKATLEINQAQLDKLLAPPGESDLAAAQAAVEVAQSGIAAADAAVTSAQAAYRDLIAGPSAEEREVNLAQVRQAEAELRRAQQAYNQVKDYPNIGTLPESAALEQATLALEIARTQAALTEESPTQAEITAALNQIAQAESTLRQAQSNLITARDNVQTLLDGADPDDIRVAEAQVEQAQIGLLQARSNVEHARLIAPFPAVVSAINITEGEQAPTGLPAVQLTDLSRFHMDVFVDEIDIRQLAVNQPVSIRVDALPDTPLSGIVTNIAPTASDVNGVIAYQVTVAPDDADAPLRDGMSATAIITTAAIDDALLLPNRYIIRDRESGRAFVNKLVDTAPVLQEIELGMRNERVSQVLAGLNDGDEVALVTQSSEEQLRGALFGGGQ